MSEAVSTPLKLFYCYAHEDKALRDALDSHLISLKRQKLIEIWYDGKISPGTDWEREINTYLHSADIVLLLISADFLSSDYAYSKEMAQALDRHNNGTARVVPIILRPVDWEDEPFSKLQILPTEAKPVTRWTNPDDAYEDIARALRGMVKDLLRKPLALQWFNKGNKFSELKQYKEALEAYEEALRLDPTDADFYSCKGMTLHSLKRFEEALEVYEEALHLDPTYVFAYKGKGDALRSLERYEEALEAYEEALGLDPSYSFAYTSKGTALYFLDRYEEALEAYEEVLRLDPTYAVGYVNKGYALNGLKRYEEALEASEEALRLDPTYALAYDNMAFTLNKLGRTKEAQQARKKARQLGFSR